MAVSMTQPPRRLLGGPVGDRCQGHHASEGRSGGDGDRPLTESGRGRGIGPTLFGTRATRRARARPVAALRLSHD